MNLKPILQVILEDYALPLNGDHGVAHWARVLENGLDRLDLGRVGIMPHPTRLCTDFAKRPETIKWADGRASFGIVPTFVLDEWGIDLEQERTW
jgi:hypothetical protein